MLSVAEETGGFVGDGNDFLTDYLTRQFTDKLFELFIEKNRSLLENENTEAGVDVRPRPPSSSTAVASTTI